MSIAAFFKRKRKSDFTYPTQFWLLFWGVFVNRLASSMLWPFFTIYMYQQMNVPLTTVTLLLTLRAVFSVISTSIVSPIMDKIGRKGAMIVGMTASAFVFFAMAMGFTQVWVWALLIAAHGTVLPVFNIGVQAMTADLVPKDHRAPAYALIRTISNAGIAIGPAIGGWIALISVSVVFNITGVAFIILAILTAIILRETNPTQEKTKVEHAPPAGGYSILLQDGIFIAFMLMLFITSMAYAQIWSLLPVYVVENFGMAANQYSLVMTINASMVVLLQYGVTKITDRFRPYSMMTLGALLYTIGLTSVAGGSLLWHFMVSMAIMTLGELVLQPTATTLVANMAPDDMRARYLGVLSLAYPIGAGLGPVVGGFLNDMIAPVAIWYGAGAMGAIGTVGYFILWQIRNRDYQPH